MKQLKISSLARTAMMLLMMLLTTATAWAIKTETTSYSITYSNDLNGKKFHITVVGSSETASWNASVTSGNIYWKEKEIHLLANGMTIKPDQNVFYINNSVRTDLNSSTTFTFTASNDIPSYHRGQATFLFAIREVCHTKTVIRNRHRGISDLFIISRYARSSLSV